MTRTLVRACRVVGVTLLDHVVVARTGSSSIRELLDGFDMTPAAAPPIGATPIASLDK